MFCARTLMHAMAVLSVVHASLLCFRFGVLLVSRSATWRSAKSQSGCPSFGSLLTTVQRQSATRHCQVGRRGQLDIVACHQPSCSGSEFCQAHSKSPVLVERGLSFGSRESKALIYRLRSRGRIAVNSIHRHATAQGVSHATAKHLSRF